MNQKQRRSNGSSSGDKSSARNALELKDKLVEGAGGNPLLEHVNLGQGNYKDTDYWQQIRSYRRGLFLHTAFANIISERAIKETKIKLGREGYNAQYNDLEEAVDQFDPANNKYDFDRADSPRQKILEHGNWIWERLGDPATPISEKQVAAILDKTGATLDWLPISWQMVLGRHEASRSRDAELIRDVLSNVRHIRTDGDGDGSGSAQLQKVLQK